MKKFLFAIAVFACLAQFGLFESQAHAVSRITSDEAKKAALQKVDGEIINVGLEHEKDILIYDVDIRSGDSNFEVIVDASDGKIVEVKKVIED